MCLPGSTKGIGTTVAERRPCSVGTGGGGGAARLRLRGRPPGVADVVLETWRPERRGDPAGRSPRGPERPFDAVEGDGVALDLDGHDALPDARVTDGPQRVPGHEPAAP